MSRNYVKGQKRPYNQQVQRGDLIGAKCQGPECNKPAVVHLLCNSHYYQVRRGKGLSVIRRYKTGAPSE